MGRGAAARRRAGGGERIPAARPVRTRVVTALAALVLLGGIVAYAVFAGERLRPVVAAVGGLGWTLVVVALAARWPAVLTWGVAGVGAGYAVFVGLHSESADGRAPLVATAFVLAAELAFWSLDAQAGRSQRALLLRRLLFLAVLALATLVVSGLLLVISSSAEAGLGLEALGVLAAVTVLGVVAAFSVRARSR